MKKKIIILAAVVVLAGVITGVVFANSRMSFDAELLFDSATDDTLVLNVTNRGGGDLTISKNAHYIDELGSAGSWDCTADEDVVVGPGQSKYIHYYLPEAVAHGDHSVMAFYFMHDDYWYLCKVGVEYGMEIYADHD